MSHLQSILTTYRATSQSEREKGSYFEELSRTYFRCEAIVNGKPALEWVMERQSVATDKDSGIINDANLRATETMGNPKYPLELFLRVVTLELETMKVVNGLPGLEISVESSS